MVKYFKIFVNVLCLHIMISQATESDLFNIFTKCHRRDTECLTSQLQKGVVNYAHTGLTKYNLKSFDPLRLPYVKSERNTNSPFNVDLIFDNMDIIGLAKAKVIKVANLDAELKSSALDIDLPKLLVKGDYEVHGNILIFPITGKGKAKILIESSRAKIILFYVDVPKSDPNYGKVKEIKLQLFPKRVVYHLDGLFNGNTELSEAMHEVLNSNSLEIFNEIAPNIIQGVCLVLKDVLNEFFLKNKYDELFL